jgi:hypothetical protein
VAHRTRCSPQWPGWECSWMTAQHQRPAQTEAGKGRERERESVCVCCTVVCVCVFKGTKEDTSKVETAVHNTELTQHSPTLTARSAGCLCSSYCCLQFVRSRPPSLVSMPATHTQTQTHRHTHSACVNKVRQGRGGAAEHSTRCCRLDLLLAGWKSEHTQHTWWSNCQWMSRI